MDREPNAGFTLIEISVVLVIIGLIVGGVLVGRDLIYAALVRKAGSDVERLQLAINTFKIKYNCLPGDCSVATTLFGSNDAAGNTVNNGDGNGLYDNGYEGTLSLYHHLALAGLPFKNGNNGQWGVGIQRGINVPDLDWADQNFIASSGTYMANGVSMYVSDDWWGGNGSGFTNGCEHNQTWMIAWRDGKRKIIIDGIRNAVNAFMCGFAGPGGLSRSFAIALDTKFDDGVPTTGRVRVPPMYPYSGDTCQNAAGYLTTAVSVGDTCLVGFIAN